MEDWFRLEKTGIEKHLLLQFFLIWQILGFDNWGVLWVPTTQGMLIHKGCSPPTWTPKILWKVETIDFT